ncbi:hypothetical protein D9M71_439280 [compost metagenome]
MDHAGRVDGADALGHHLHLGLAHGAFYGMHLAVGVGDADVVQVEQGDLAHSGAGQGLCRPGAHAADADHRHMGRLQPGKPVQAIKPGNAAETLVCIHADHSHRQPWGGRAL